MSLHNANILLSIVAYLSANGLKSAGHFQNYGLVGDRAATVTPAEALILRPH